MPLYVITRDRFNRQQKKRQEINSKNDGVPAALGTDESRRYCIDIVLLRAAVQCVHARVRARARACVCAVTRPGLLVEAHLGSLTPAASMMTMSMDDHDDHDNHDNDDNNDDDNDNDNDDDDNDDHFNLVIM